MVAIAHILIHTVFDPHHPLAPAQHLGNPRFDAALALGLIITQPGKLVLFPGEVADAEALSIVQARCASCHAAQPTDATIKVAPKGVHLETLEQEGLIERGAGLSRSVRLTARGRSLLEIDSELETTNLPMAARELVVVGQIAAGGPIEAYEERSETVAVPEFMSTPDSYLLKIRGDSMIDAQIADGDYVVIKPSKVAADGDIVVAQVEENEVTLKQLFRETGRVRLQPANKAYKPMYYPTVNVQGVLVGVLRRVH